MLASHARLLFAAGIVLTLSASDSEQFLVSASKAATADANAAGERAS